MEACGSVFVACVSRYAATIGNDAFAMTLSHFLRRLGQTGDGLVEGHEALTVDEDARVLLQEWDAIQRLALAGNAPPFSSSMGIWAGRLLYTACEMFVRRDLSAEDVGAQLAIQCPDVPEPSRSYSADLVLRFLPDLIALARRVSPGDPLVLHLLDIARRWPLSSVGVPDLQGIQPPAFLRNASLLQLYVDRILATQDVSRLNDPVVQEAARISLGMYESLAPFIASALADANAR